MGLLYLIIIIIIIIIIIDGPYSSVDIATGYGLNGSEIESRWRLNFPHLSRPALGHNVVFYTMGTGSFPG